MLEDFINAIKSKNKQSIRSKKWKNWILYSNDGLIFVTYDHYESFAEVV